MVDQDWSAIKITPGGWEYCYYEYDLPPLFITNSLQAEQAAPDSRATIQDIKKLFDFCNIPGPDQQLLTVVWLISAFIPTLKIPILYVYGEKGSGKTFFTKALAQIADPNVTDPTTQDVNVLGQPRTGKRPPLRYRTVTWQPMITCILCRVGGPTCYRCALREEL